MAGSPINVAIIGVGNCASSLVQGLGFYGALAADDPLPPGVMHNTLGGYTIGDIKIVAAFDVDARKVGRPLGEAIFAPPNNTLKFCAPAADSAAVVVKRGMTHDGIGQYLQTVVRRAPGETSDVAGELRATGAQILLNYLPVGSEEATKWYAEQALTARCALINCIPVFIASEKYWANRFMQAGLPVIGDDIKSQVGATILHRTLAALFRARGVDLERTYQLNVGGNTDFLNMLERSRLASKKISKTRAVTSTLGRELPADNVHIGPSDYVPWLADRKIAFIRLEGAGFGGAPISVELKLEVWDSPNSAGVVIDAIRCARLAMDRGLSGALAAPSAYFMKSPPLQASDDMQARTNLEQWL